MTRHGLNPRPSVRRARQYLPFSLDYLRESNRGHAGLVAALAAGDPLKAVEITRGHVEALHRTMLVGVEDQRG